MIWSVNDLFFRHSFHLLKQFVVSVIREVSLTLYWLDFAFNGVGRRPHYNRGIEFFPELWTCTLGSADILPMVGEGLPPTKWD